MSTTAITPKIITQAQLDDLAVFPLPGAVFFPHTLLPLHIFEPRYRQMVTDALEEEAPIAVTLLRPGYEREYEGRPDIHTVAGIGHIVHHERMADGRFNIVLQGAGRVRIAEEHPPQKLYRRVRASLLEDDLQNTQAIAEQMSTLRGCVFGLGNLRPRLAGLLSKRLSTLTDPAALSDNICSLLLPDHDIRQAMLEQLRVDVRLQTVNAVLTEVLLDSSDDPSLMN